LNGEEFCSLPFKGEEFCSLPFKGEEFCSLPFKGEEFCSLPFKGEEFCSLPFKGRAGEGMGGDCSKLHNAAWRFVMPVNEETKNGIRQPNHH
jgi:hypothetical protein